MGEDGRMHVELRPWTVDDAAALLAALNESPDLVKQFGSGDLTTLAGCEKFIRRNLAADKAADANFAICADGQVVGNVGLSNIEHTHETGWVYYWTTTAFRGQGLASRALVTVAAWAFDEVGLFRLELGHRVNNPASCRVAEKAGFRAEGVERLKLRYGRERYDVETHARLRTDPAPAGLEPIALRR